jgi:hypothetical protein
MGKDTIGDSHLRRGGSAAPFAASSESGRAERPKGSSVVAKTHKPWAVKPLKVVSSLMIVAALASAPALAGAVRGQGVSPGTSAQVAAAVAAAPSITSIPGNVTPTLADAERDTASKSTPSLGKCQSDPTTKSPCLYGDTRGTKTMVLWGDSHAYMWFPAVNAIAKRHKWKLVMLFDYGCPVADISVWNTITNGPYTSCNTFRQNVIAAINELKPALLIVSEEYAAEDSNQKPIKTTRWTSALKKTLGSIGSRVKKVLIGDTIDLAPVTSGTTPLTCLASYPNDVQTCSTSESNATYAAERNSEMAAASAERAGYINVIPWSCSDVCTAIIGNMIVYYSQGHFTATYDTYLTNVLYQSLQPLM